MYNSKHYIKCVLKILADMRDAMTKIIYCVIVSILTLMPT